MLRRLGRAVLLLGLPSALSAQSPPVGSSQTPTPAALSRAASSTPGSAIRGHIVAVDTGRPLRGARVQVTGVELPAPRVTMTDLTGAYEFANLPSGRFTVSATMASFIGLSYGQTRPFEAGKPIVLADKQTLEPIDLRLPRGGAIAGVVLDEVGQPLINAAVTAFRPQFVRGIRQLASMGRAQTNDIGAFRISGLTPGSYFVSASRTFLVGPPVSVDAESGYAPAFFPGTSSEANASRVVVRLGQTSGGVTITLDPSKVGSIAGSVFMADGQPAPLLGAAIVTIRALGRTDVRPTLNMSDGLFLAVGLPPGDYELRAMTLPVTPNSGPPQGATKRVSLNGENLKGLRMDMQPLPAGTGRLVVDSLATGCVPLATIRIRSEWADPSESSNDPAPSVTPAADMSFTMYAPAGRMRVRPTLPTGWALKAVRVGNNDFTDAGVEFRSGETVRDIEVEITNRPAGVSGSARNLKGERVDDYAVILFSRERERWNGDSRYFAAMRSDQRGTFNVSGLAPGDYYGVALDYLDPAEAQDPALLDRLQREATPFSLQDGEAKSVDLKVVQP